jgi:CheY-like chemotaxis protein
VTSRKVLDVGSCRPDHAAIRRLLEDNFDATVAQARDLDDTLEALRSDHYDLVLINRKLDRSHRDGVELIRAIKADRELSRVPVMLITNLPEHEQRAVDLGAEPGFGKAALDAPATLERLRRLLE